MAHAHAVGAARHTREASRVPLARATPYRSGGRQDPALAGPLAPGAHALAVVAAWRLSATAVNRHALPVPRAAPAVLGPRAAHACGGGWWTAAGWPWVMR